MARGVSLPSAEKTEARARPAAPPLCVLLDMLSDIFALNAPAPIVHAKCFIAALGRYFVKSGFHDSQPGSSRGLLQRELDQRGRLAGIVLVGIDGVGMPGEREQPLRLHALHDRFPVEMLVTRVGNVPARDLAWDEWAFKPDPEPSAELAMVGEGGPH